MSGIPLQSNIIYGPILSRRLGRSLGINLMPENQKICSFDCIYCQYGENPDLMKMASRKGLPTISEVLYAVEEALKKPRTLDYLTFSGNGEPTIHPDFSEIVQAVKEIKDRIRPQVNLAVLSNSSRVVDPHVVAALRLMDAPMMKLDAGDEVTFQAINRPVTACHLVDILAGLKTMPNLMVQSMLLDGEESNIRGSAYEAWAEVLGELQPRKIHIYSTSRPTAHTQVRCVPPHKLKQIEKDLRERFELTVEAFWQE
jgi:wyosine [tRNA(Phe)-imidazoG37] synthetase (radical SAM superfamily)